MSEPQETAPWEDLDEASAREAVLAGQSLLVTGFPRVGKSHFVAGLCQELEAQGLTASILSKTHASCAALNGKLVAVGCSFRAQTADHWANATLRRGVCQSDCIVLEEVTMLNRHLWNLIAKAALVCPQWICMGDFRQFGAIDSYCGCQVQVSLEQSDLLHQLCGARRLQLAQNHRSDPELFSFYTSITEDLHTYLEQARQQFPLQTGVPRYSLSVSHATRVYINSKYNRRQRLEHPDAIQFKHSASPGLAWPRAHRRRRACQKGVVLYCRDCRCQAYRVKGSGSNPESKRRNVLQIPTPQPLHYVCIMSGPVTRWGSVVGDR